MSRIEPIRPSLALVALPGRSDERAGDREDVSAPERPRVLRPATMPRPALGDAAAAAAFELHRLSGGPPRGLKADHAVRSLWLAAYAEAVRGPASCGDDRALA